MVLIRSWKRTVTIPFGAYTSCNNVVTFWLCRSLKCPSAHCFIRTENRSICHGVVKVLLYFTTSPCTSIPPPPPPPPPLPYTCGMECNHNSSTPNQPIIYNYYMLYDVGKCVWSPKASPPHVFRQIRFKQLGVHRPFFPHHSFARAPHSLNSLGVHPCRDNIV